MGVGESSHGRAPLSVPHRSAAAAVAASDTIKTRMQLQPVKYPNILTTGATIAREEGVRSLWKGLTPFAAHLYSKYALRFGTNAFFQTALADKDGKLTTGRRVLAGLGAGVMEALVIVTPFEVIKIRLQNQHGLDKTKLKYQGPVDALVKTVKNEVRQAGGQGARVGSLTPTTTCVAVGHACRVCWPCGRALPPPCTGTASTKVSSSSSNRRSVAAHG